MKSVANFCVFEYQYRDASNYKAWNCILLEGQFSKNDENNIRTCLESGEFFVAEQVNLPPLEELWGLSGGPTEDDHSLHEFIALRSATPNDHESYEISGKLSDLIRKFQSVTCWDYSLSPNYAIPFK
jgi:hypothetical protein